MNTNVLDLNNDIFNVIGDYVKKDNLDRILKEKLRQDMLNYVDIQMKIKKRSKKRKHYIGWSGQTHLQPDGGARQPAQRKPPAAHKPPARNPPLSDAAKSLQARRARDQAPTKMAIPYSEIISKRSRSHGICKIIRHQYCAGRWRERRA
jgi:hypothetical protein